MFCEYCGKELQENELCDCRKKVNAFTNIAKGNKTIKPWMLGVAALVIIVIVAALFLTGKEKVDLAAYINSQPEMRGLNGKATIEFSDLFDDSALETDLLEGLDKTDASKVENMSEDQLESLFASAGEGFLECEQAVNDIEIRVWKDGEEVWELTELSNGMKIKVEASSVNPVNDYLGKSFQTGTVTFTVEGLTDGQAVNVFELVGMQVSFFGTDGNGRAGIEWDEEALQDLYVNFYVENNDECSNGDEIKVVLDYDAEEWEAQGYFPVEESRTYVVEGLNSVLTSIGDIPEEQLDEMKAEVENTLKKQAETDWKDGISIENMTYLGSYLLTKKSGSTTLGAPSILYMVYQVDVFENFAPNGGEDTHFSYYYYGSYEGLQLDLDGKINMEMAYKNECWNGFTRRVNVNSSILLGTELISYDGFEKLEDLFETCVAAYADQYHYESTVTE